MMQTPDYRLAIHGGPPAKQNPDPPMYPGGMAIAAEEEEAVMEVLRAKRLFRYFGPGEAESQASQLEQTFAEMKGARYANAVTSGTAALICGLHGIGIGPGDEVIVPAYTWIASASAVVAVGGVPVIAEVDETLLLDPADVERKITPYTKAIMPVHMRGAPCPMDELVALANRRQLKVIEDVAQANGGSYKGRALGTFGDVGCFSLQFNKIITSGEGGMVITDDESIWKRVNMYHDVIGALNLGFDSSELLCGVNYRMPELLAAVRARAVAPAGWADRRYALSQAHAQGRHGGCGPAQRHQLSRIDRPGGRRRHLHHLFHGQPDQGSSRGRGAAS